MNAHNQPNPYLRTKVLTASPQELRLMLYDGAIKFARQAVAALEKSDWETMYNGLIRAQKIVLELQNGLKPEIEPELCERLNALYTYMYRRLVDANLERDTAPIHEVIRLLDYERETWVMVMKKLANGEGDNAEPSEVAAEVRNPVGRIGPEAERAGREATGTEQSRPTSALTPGPAGGEHVPFNVEG